MEVVNLPAAKDLKLLTGHWTKDQRESKEKAKASVTPSVKLRVPIIIKNNINFYRIWKETIKLYNGTQLLNALDVGLLTRYCIEMHSLENIYERRAEYDKTGLDNMLKIETRIEAKTKMLNQMALALYMTPRARAGSIPNQPDKKAEDDPNAEMFD
jgi:phage terminase small subunit